MTLVQLSFSSTFLLGALGLVFHRIHLLSALLCLESIMLSLFIALASWALQTSSPNFSSTPLVLLVFSACEAGVGLALMVATARTHGSDHMQNLTLLQC